VKDFASVKMCSKIQVLLLKVT